MYTQQIKYTGIVTRISGEVFGNIENKFNSAFFSFFSMAEIKNIVQSEMNALQFFKHFERLF